MSQAIGTAAGFVIVPWTVTSDVPKLGPFVVVMAAVGGGGHGSVVVGTGTVATAD
jgi:translation initiation factor 6 (eIF-6)